MYRVTLMPLLPLIGGAAKFPHDGPSATAAVSAGYVFR